MMQMTPSRVFRSTLMMVAALTVAASIAHYAHAQAPAGATFDETIAPGNNFDKADFRLWYPADVSVVQAVIVLVPGSNGDGRPEAADPAWQAFATRHKLALVGVHLTDKQHPQSFIEEYANVSKGSGQAFLDVLTSLAATSKHSELANAPLLLWGMSAGGEFNYEFTAWKPDRVVAFVVNKGGIYYTALASKAARDVPGMLYIGGKDLESRVDVITGLFAVNRRSGALWALAEEPTAAHIVGRSKDLTLRFFEDVLPLRIAPSGGALRAIDEKSGFLGDFKTRTFAAATAPAANPQTSWLPTERVARAWQAMLTEQPFDR
jgi:poly(3-hydroxybutyrate) depolymerase